MKYFIKKADDDNMERWNDFVFSEHPGIVPYHRYEWRKIISQSYQLDSEYIFVESEAGAITGILPLFFLKFWLQDIGISLAHCHYAGIVAIDNASRDLLVNQALMICRARKLKFIELREIDLTLKTIKNNLIRQVMPLENSITEQWRKQGKSCSLYRNYIRKAEKNSLEIVEGGLDFVEVFYKIYQKSMHRLGTPAHSKGLFLRTLENFGEEAAILLVKKNDTVVGGLLIYRCGKTAHFPWSACLKSFYYLRPYDLLYWRAICWAIDRGCKKLDFGRSRRGSGVHIFKNKWDSTISIPLTYSRLLPSGDILIEDNTITFKQRIFINTWPRLPAVLTSNIGPYLRSHIP